MCRATPAELAWELQRALTILGVPTVRAAVTEAARRGLLL
jgi:hypothetical protein